MKGVARALVLAAVLAAAASGAWVWWQRPQAVDAVQVQTRPLIRTLQFTARVATPARVELGATLTARVARVRVDEGDAIRAGEALVELETDEPRAAQQQADASLKQSQATLRAAERDLPRTQELVAQGFYSQQKLDDARKAVEVARAQREAAQAALEAARARLAQHVVRAPSDGLVLLRNVDPGQIVQAGKSLLTVSVLGPMELVAQVDERFLGQLQVGQAARVLADAFADRPFDAQVLRIAPAVNAQSGSVEVRLSVGGERPAFLREDMTLSVEVRTGERSRAKVLPLRALRASGALGGSTAVAGSAGTAGEVSEVWVIESGRAVPRQVRLGLRTLTEVEVTQGLQDGDIVILDAPSLQPGGRVRVRPLAQP